MGLAAAAIRSLDTDGFVVLEDFVDADFLERPRGRVEQLFFEDGRRAGVEFKHDPDAAGWPISRTRAQSSFKSSACPGSRACPPRPGAGREAE